MQDSHDRRPDRLSSALDDLGDAFTDARRASMEEGRRMMALAAGILRRELDSGRVDEAGPERRERIARALRESVGLGEALEEIRALEEIERPDVPDRDALVEGRVVDGDGEGIRGHRVSLVGARGNRLESFGTARTGAHGYFALVAEIDAVEGEEGTHRVRLVVESPDGDAVHEHPRPVSLEKSVVRVSFGNVVVEG